MKEGTSVFTLYLADERQTAQFGEDLSLALKPGDCVALSGEIGAGKSTLARALLRAMADDAALDVPSPTFTLVQQYDLRIPVAHFDLYRLGDPDELHELGFDEFLAEGICLVEWPEMAMHNLPDDHISLALEHEGAGRKATVTARGARAVRIGRTLLLRHFLELSGMENAKRRHLSGDASSRAYETILQDGQPDLILMDWPKPPEGPAVLDGRSYAEIAHIAREPRPFVAIAEYLRHNGFTAPAVQDVDFGRGIIVLEDLGREGVLDENGRPIASRYLESAGCLAHLHALHTPASLPVRDGHNYEIPPFDAAAMKIEVSLLPDWFLAHRRGTPPDAGERAEYFAIWDELIGKLAGCETGLLLRDFHSPNILWQPHLTGIAQVGLIDFQDAMLGPTAYDLASLVQDARVDIPADLSRQMMDRYLDLRRKEAGFDEALFLRTWSIMAAQRNCKLAGIWVRLMKRDGKPGYMKHMPRTMRYLDEALRHPDLGRLRIWLSERGIETGES